MTLDQIRQALAASPFISFLGIDLRSHDAASGRMEAILPFRPEFARLSGSDHYHGGVIATFIDTVGDCAAALQTSELLPTINFRTDFLAPARGELSAVAIVRRMGRRVSTVDVDVTDAAGRVVAVGRCTFAVG